jgi:hypothetical protein
MFDNRDPDFRKSRSEPRLGVPVLTDRDMIFLSEDRFPFDEYNAEFVNTTAESRLLPPVMLPDWSIRCVMEH